MSSSEDEYEWVTFAQSYLLLAKLACQELEDTRENKHRKITRFDPPGLNLIYSPADLFFPVVFNIKQGVENFIKDAISRITDTIPKNTHDVKELFETLKKVWPTDIEPIKDTEGDEITADDIRRGPERLNSLQDLVLKFYYWNFSEEWRALGIQDKKNDVSRYPVNKTGISVDASLVKDELIGKLHEDCDILYRTFNDLGYIIAIWKKHRSDPDTSASLQEIR